jgi:hypothetical protein
MSVILVTVGLVFGAYLYQPLWFDSGPYHYVSSHEALADCEKAKLGNEHAVCANGELYMKDSSVSKTEKVETIEVNDFVFTIDKQDSTDTTMKSHWNE